MFEMKSAFLMAQFIGKDGSMEYQKGKVYPLVVCRFGWLHKLFNGWIIEIKKIDGGGWYSYKNDKTFLENWLVLQDDFKIIKKVKWD